jgi:hypothetical protein
MEYDPNLSKDAKRFLFFYPLRFIIFANFAFFDTFSIKYLVLCSCSRYAFPSWSYPIAGAYYAWSFTRLQHIRELVQILILRSRGALPWQRVLFTVIYNGIPSVAYAMAAQGCYRALYITGPIRSIRSILDFCYVATGWTSTLIITAIFAWLSWTSTEREEFPSVCISVLFLVARLIEPIIDLFVAFCHGKGYFLIYWWRIWERRADRGVLKALPNDFVENLVDGSSRELEFRYEPLACDGQIRLLELTMGPYRNIEGKMVHTSLETAPTYAAVSYTWGDPKTCYGLTVDGTLLPITASVYDIIQRLTPLFGSTTLWIDSICINQKDGHEKSKQVRMMREIYSSASEVIACTGNIADNDADIAEHFLRRFHEDGNRQEPRIRRAAQQGLKLLGRRRSPQWAALSKLLNQPYWTRVWIIQEIANAKKLRVMCGDREISWDDLAFMVLSFSDEQTDPFLDIPELLYMNGKSDLSSLIQIGLIVISREQVQSKADSSIRDVLPLTISFNATDPRDHFFAIQGIVEGAIDQHLLPDYSQKTEEIFIKVACHFVAQDDPLWIFAYAGVGSNRNYTQLPSWVPDWSQKAYTASAEPMSDEIAVWLTDNAQPSSLCADQSKLRTQATFVDRVSRVTPIPDAENLQGLLEGDLSDPISRAETSRENWSKLRAMVAQAVPDPYVNGEPRTDALWRTLVGYKDNTARARELFAVFDEDISSRTKLRERIAEKLAAVSSFRDFWKAAKAIVPILREFYALAIMNLAHISPALGSRCTGRRLAVTDRGYIALVSRGTKPLDEIFLIPRARTPLVLRSSPTLASNCYQLVGDCYVHGLNLDHLQKIAGPPEWINVF